MITLSDIQEAVVSLWNTRPGLTARVPGGIHYGKVGEKDEKGEPLKAPYISFLVTEGPVEYTGTKAYTQVWTVHFRLFSDQDGEPTGEITRRLLSLYDLGHTSLVLPNLQTLLLLYSNRKDGEQQTDEASRRASDVLAYECHYEWLVQGSLDT